MRYMKAFDKIEHLAQRHIPGKADQLAAEHRKFPKH